MKHRGEFVGIVYELAWYWHINPFDLFDRPLSDIRELLMQHNRIQARSNSNGK